MLLEELRDEDLHEHGIDMDRLREEVEVRKSLAAKRDQQEEVEQLMGQVVIRG